MEIGIFAKTFARPGLEQTLDAVAAHGINCVQFNFSILGQPTLPASIDAATLTRVRRELESRRIRMAAISGTFNMIDPDDRGREEGLSRLAVLADACQHLGTPVITLSTGTRDPLDMWRRHPDNDSRGAWRDLIRSVYRAVEDTESSGLTLAFEPEVSNVVDSAEKARKLLDEVRSPRLKVVMDPANLFHTGELQNARPIMEQAFSLLGDSIAIAHAKDLAKDGEAGHLAAGQGLLDYDQYLALLDASGFDGALVLHGLAESDVDASLAFLEAKLGAVAGQVGR